MAEGDGFVDGGYVDIGPEEDFPEGHGRRVEIGARRLAVFCVEGRLYAIKDYCPHEGVPLHRGRVEDGEVICPGHGWRFDLSSGRSTAGEGDARVAVYPIRVENGRVLVGTR